MELNFFVHLVGDSTIDNIHWTGFNREDCIAGQLESELGGDYCVMNFAYDGFTTTDVLEGGRVGAVFERSVGNERYPSEHYLEARTGSRTVTDVKPLDKIQTQISDAPEETHFVVISVGGNDFRLKLHRPLELISEIENVQRRYLQILQQVQQMRNENVKPILMFQYRTDARNRPYRIYTILGTLGYIATAVNILALGMIAYSAYSLISNKERKVPPPTTGKIPPAPSIWKNKYLRSVGGMLIGTALLYGSHRQLSLRVTKEILTGKHAGIAVFGAFIERLYQPILQKAKEDNLPILDLPNLFDPLDPNLYNTPDCHLFFPEIAA